MLHVEPMVLRVHEQRNAAAFWGPGAFVECSLERRMESFGPWLGVASDVGYLPTVVWPMGHDFGNKPQGHALLVAVGSRRLGGLFRPLFGRAPSACSRSERVARFLAAAHRLVGLVWAPQETRAPAHVFLAHWSATLSLFADICQRSLGALL